MENYNINNIADLANESKKIKDENQLIQIINNPEFKWIYKTYDIEQSRVKCKYFDDTPFDYIFNFTNKQRFSVEKRIKKNINSFRNDNADSTNLTLTFIISDKGIKYGEIINGLEFGASHLHLVESREERVIIGGEISVNFRNNYLQFNLLSGTFSLDIFRDIENKYGMERKILPKKSNLTNPLQIIQKLKKKT